MATRPAPITRTKPPTAHVVVISGPPPKSTPEGQPAPVKPVRERLEEAI
jgi:hypothetical protein